MVSDPVLLPVLRYPTIDSLSINFPRGHGDLRELAYSRGVRDLTILDPAVEDLSVLEHMHDLRRLILRATGKLDLRTMARKNDITSLDLGVRNVLHFDALKSFEKLRTLEISVLPDVFNIHKFLSPRLKLARFGLWNAITMEDLDELLDVPAIAHLNFLLLSNCRRLRTIEGIETLADTITGLFLSAPHLEDIARIKMLPKINFLNIHLTPLADLSFISPLTDLRILHLGGTGTIPPLAPLRELQNLEHLFLWGDDGVDLTPLAGKEGLTVRNEGARNRQIRGGEDLGKDSKVVNRGR